jgi:hypothetical protein
MQWNGFQLAANAHADSGRIEVQNFMAWRKTIQVLGEASWTESATNLFWTPRGKGALLEIDIDAPTTGEYDGLLGLVEGTDYGKVECSLNFQSIGQFDGRSRKVTIGRGLRFESVRLQAGKNTLRLRTLEKSAASNGYNVGVAYLELKPRSD